MRTILIILSALGAAILVLNLLKSWQRRHAEKRGETVSDRVSVIHLISVVVGLAVFFIGVLWLESSSAPPGSVYAPATIEDGTVKSGGFDTQK
tara:strand:+ start:197 stop:475 length:279 start_codon:yes stop_codon:yes gene_type:complete